MLELPLLILSMLFPKVHREPDWMICDEDRPLVRLSHVGRREGFQYFVAGFVGISVEEWKAAYRKDPRDVPWVFVSSEDGHRVPYCRFDIGWSKERKEVWLKWTSCFSQVRDDRWSRMKARFGIAPEVVEQERAPIGWRKLSKRETRRRLRSEGREDVLTALTNLGQLACGAQLEWASDILVFCALDADRVVRRVAINGLGELARVRGYVDRDRVERLLAGAMRDECKWVREAAERAKDEIGRFAGGK